jgi:DNA-binding PadR family transcriptional regulator
MEKKYQIFVSSTYEDLKEERDIVIKAILEMGHIPVGMEMFSAGDEQQWQIIQKQIDDCDYYVVILAFRYGSMDGDISYTEKEYVYAESKGVPALGFLINESVKWPANRIDKTPQKVEKLESFRQKVGGKSVSFWKDKSDLYGKVSISLMKQFNTNPRVGWVKATDYSGPEILKEISRLSTENAELRKKTKIYEEQIDRVTKEASQKTLDTLKHNKRKISFYYVDSSGWEDTTEFNLQEIFNLLAQELMIENSTKYCSTYLGFLLQPNEKKNLRNKWPIPLNTVRGILADLNVLEIIKPSSRKHSLKDSNEYWTLTDEGKKLFKEIRREILEKNLDKAQNDDLEDLGDINKKPKTRNKTGANK